MTRNCNGDSAYARDSAYANGFPILATDINVAMLRIFAASDSMHLGR